MKRRILLIVISFLLLLMGCKGTNELADQVIIGIDEDVDSFNPLYSFKVNEGRISELLFLSLVRHKWNEKKSIILKVDKNTNMTVNRSAIAGQVGSVDDSETEVIETQN